MTDLLEDIKNKHSKKIITSLCNKLQEKCSFKSGNDLHDLADLALWLYMHGDTDNAEKIINFTNNVVFDGNYDIWDYIHIMWALKARILRENGNKEDAQIIISTLITHNLKSNRYYDAPEEIRYFRERFINRSTYNDFRFAEEIEKELANGDVREANFWRFAAVQKLIRYKEEGVYPDLINNDDLVEKEINDYIGILKHTSV